MTMRTADLLRAGDALGAERAGQRVRAGAAVATGRGALALMTVTAVAAALARGQVAALGRRRWHSQAPLAVDVTVMPSRGTVGGAVVELGAFGDSAMAGVGVDRLDDVLSVQLAQRVADGTGRAVHVVGYARSGARTLDVLTRQVPAVRRTPDVSVLVVGTNDVIHATPPLVLTRISQAMLDALETIGAPVVMSSLPEFRAMVALPSPVMSVARGYGGLVGAVQRRAAGPRPRVNLVDVLGAVGEEFVEDPDMMSTDSFHPSAVGYGRIADALAPAVLAHLGSSER
jgi:lysophospholipase L1-like esterase